FVLIPPRVLCNFAHRQAVSFEIDIGQKSYVKSRLRLANSERSHTMNESALALAGRKKIRKTMNSSRSQCRFPGERFRSVIAIVCVTLLSAGSSAALAQTPAAQSQVMTTTNDAQKIPNDQLDSLV